jgi:hypothetical protein
MLVITEYSPMLVTEYITPPVAARLVSRSAKWAWQAACTGKLGPVQKRGRITYIRIAELERAFNCSFSLEQLELAISGKFPMASAIAERDAVWLDYIRREFNYRGDLPNLTE